MESSDSGSKLPEGIPGKSRDSSGRKERGPSLPAGPTGSIPASGDVTHREPSGKGGKGKSSTPKKKSSSVKEPSQSSILQKETLPVEPKVMQRANKSIRKTNRDATQDSLTPSSPVGLGLQSPRPHLVTAQPTMWPTLWPMLYQEAKRFKTGP